MIDYIKKNLEVLLITALVIEVFGLILCEIEMTAYPDRRFWDILTFSKILIFIPPFCIISAFLVSVYHLIFNKKT